MNADEKQGGCWGLEGGRDDRGETSREAMGGLRCLGGDGSASDEARDSSPNGGLAFPNSFSIPSMKRLLLLLCPLVFTGCAAIAESMVDAAFDRNREKNDVRYHLRHGDSVEEAQRGAREDEMFRDLMSM